MAIVPTRRCAKHVLPWIRGELLPTTTILVCEGFEEHKEPELSSGL